MLNRQMLRRHTCPRLSRTLQRQRMAKNMVQRMVVNTTLTICRIRMPDRSSKTRRNGNPIWRLPRWSFFCACCCCSASSLGGP
jgi:hypothetical protein